MSARLTTFWEIELAKLDTRTGQHQHKIPMSSGKPIFAQVAFGPAIGCMQRRGP
jgi:hypothetical protein